MKRGSVILENPGASQKRLYTISHPISKWLINLNRL